MKLIVMTSPTFFVEEDQIIRNLFENGLDILHLRKPDTEAVYTERLLTLIPQEFHKKIILHDHFELQKEFNLLGIHLNKRNPYPPERYKGLITQSVHSLADLKQKKKNCDYLLLGPVFDSWDPTRKKIMEGFKEEDLIAAHKADTINKRVMALGGINLNTIHQCADLGFGGVVVTTALWNLFDIHNNADYRDLIEYFKKLKDAVD